MKLCLTREEEHFFLELMIKTKMISFFEINGTSEDIDYPKVWKGKLKDLIKAIKNTNEK